MTRFQLRRLMLAAMLAAPLTAVAGAPLITVYKSASCGCCAEWIKHLQANGFAVKAVDVADPSAHRRQAGIPDQYGSCHTGTVNGYALEGHVPAAEIRRLLKEKPKAIGLAVPAMPLGSPGMEGPRNDPYDVLLIQNNGSATVYKHYN